jgi:phosphatidylinositol kinase/protein kinase (PI-3  family)
MLEASPETASHRLSGALRTFSVVPVSPVIGLLACVPNTAPVLDSMLKGGKLRQEDLDAATRRHAEGMARLSKGGQSYDNVYMVRGAPGSHEGSYSYFCPAARYCV